MIESLRIQGYRAFEHFQLNDLARVNLLVGKNGCGKTSVLEAVQFLATGGSISSLIATAYRREEVKLIQVMETGNPEFRADIFQAFHGRNPIPSSCFSISSEAEASAVSVKLRKRTDEKTTTTTPSGVPSGDYAFVIDIEGRSYEVYENGALSVGQSFRDKWLRESGIADVHVQLVTAESLKLGDMHTMWDRIIIDSREEDVIDAMRILQPDIERIFFLAGERWKHGFAPVLVSMSETKQRVPLGSVGEGMRRMLALSLSLIQAENGVLLVDEIDTGLHYSILPGMWRLIVKAAIDSDVQVFATTHSLDCVKALASLCESYPELGGDVALHKIHSSMEQSVVFDAKNIIIAAEQGIEMR